MAYDANQTYDAGTLEVSITFTNQEAQTGEAFKMLIEHALGTVVSDLGGTMLLLPNRDETGVVLGPG